MKKVAIIMGSDSDVKIAKKAVDVLEQLGIGAIIAMAGMAAHLAGAIAANTVLPVIGVPVKSSLEGLDALLATVQMPKGIPVATVAIDGGANAAYLAAQILALEDKALSDKLWEIRRANEKDILEKDKTINIKIKGE